jgi:hypothetical protein
LKAKPVKNVPGEGFVRCTVEECTHVAIRMPGPSGLLHLPVILKGRREGTGCWTWNGDTEKPTLRPSLLTQGNYPLTEEECDRLDAGGAVEPRPYRCHTWVNDGQAQHLDDTSHELRGKTVDLLDVE